MKTSGWRRQEPEPDADLHVVPGGRAPWFHSADLVAGLTRDLLGAHADADDDSGGCLHGRRARHDLDRTAP